jgi:hypothetical protein
MSCNSLILSHLRDDVAAPRHAEESGRLCVSMFLCAELKHLEQSFSTAGTSSYRKKNLPGRGLTKVENH